MFLGVPYGGEDRSNRARDWAAARCFLCGYTNDLIPKGPQFVCKEGCVR